MKGYNTVTMQGKWPANHKQSYEVHYFRTPPSNNSSRHAKPKTPPLQWNSYQQQQLHHYKNHHHHEGGQGQDHSHDKLREQYTREALSQYNSGSTFQSRHKHRHHHRKANSDSMAEVLSKSGQDDMLQLSQKFQAWRTANSYWYYFHMIMNTDQSTA